VATKSLVRVSFSVDLDWDGRSPAETRRADAQSAV